MPREFPVEMYPENDGKAGALALIRRGLDCLEERHELVACQWHMWGIMACKHCGYILPQGYCVCGHPSADECFEHQHNEDGTPTGKGHLKGG